MYLMLLTLVIFILIRQLTTVAMIWKINGIEVVPHFVVLVLLLLFSSCSIEEALDPPTCYGGECNATFTVEGELDSNGYYHVDLDFTQQYYPRFDILIDATPTDPWWWYNEVPVVQANFYTEDTWEFQNDILPVVQPNRVYLSQKSKFSMTGKRIVGPIPPEMQGDTITIEPEVFWEAGSASRYLVFNELKIIIE